MVEVVGEGQGALVPSQPSGQHGEVTPTRLRTPRCTVCGAEMPAPVVEGQGFETATCPVCGGRDASAAAGLSDRFEERVVRCRPYELEHCAQAEAVDGWYLVDTAPVVGMPGTVEVRFRRPLRQEPTKQTEQAEVAQVRPGVGGGESTKRLPGRTAVRRGPPVTARRPAPRRSETRSAAAEATRRTVGWLGLMQRLLLLLLAVWVFRTFGFGGLVVFLLLWPQFRRLMARARGPQRQ